MNIQKRLCDLPTLYCVVQMKQLHSILILNHRSSLMLANKLKLCATLFGPIVTHVWLLLRNFCVPAKNHDWHNVLLWPERFQNPKQFKITQVSKFAIQKHSFKKKAHRIWRNKQCCWTVILSHHSKSQIFVQRFSFDKIPTFSRVFPPKFFWQLFWRNQSWIFGQKMKISNSVCYLINSPNPFRAWICVCHIHNL